MEKKLYKVFYRTGNGNESFTFIEADGEEMIKDILYSEVTFNPFSPAFISEIRISSV